MLSPKEHSDHVPNASGKSSDRAGGYFSRMDDWEITCRGLTMPSRLEWCIPGTYQQMGYWNIGNVVNLSSAKRQYSIRPTSALDHWGAVAQFMRIWGMGVTAFSGIHEGSTIIDVCPSQTSLICFVPGVRIKKRIFECPAAHRMMLSHCDNRVSFRIRCITCDHIFTLPTHTWDLTICGNSLFSNAKSRPILPSAKVTVVDYPQ